MLYACAACVLLAALLALPSVAWAGTTGGAGLGSTPSGGNGSSSSASSGPSSSATTSPGNISVSSTGNGITLITKASAMLRRQMSFSGTASAGAAGRTIEIERLGHETDWQWAPTVTATVAGNGSFSAVWNTDHIGRFSFRALFLQTGMSAAGSAAAPTVVATVYRPSIASWYGGPGLWGRHTACGERLTKTTIGLANRTLKCGTKVALYYRGRTMTVPVIDRGPYANHADWDLTEATGHALRMLSVGVATIGAVSLPQQPPLPFNTR